MKKNEIRQIDYHHKINVQIRFNDIDMFGHLNNTVYLQFFDQGKYAYFKQFMDGSFGSEPTAPVVANINVDFHQPAYIDDKLSVSTAIKEIAESSMVMYQQITDAKGNIKSTARVIMVNIDVTNGLPTPVSEAWRAKINNFENQ